MSRYSRDDLDIDYAENGIGETRKTADGGMVIAMEKWASGFDATEMFKDLPDGACWEQHWGYVVKGAGVVRYTDGMEEEISAGQAYYLRPGHVPRVEGGDDLELVEFTPQNQRPDHKPS